MAISKKNPAKRRSAKSQGQEPASNPNPVRIIHSGEKSREAIMAEKAYDPTVRSLAGSRIFINNTVGEQALTECLEALNAQVKEVQEGNLEVIEKTLVAQANTFDSIFNALACRAALNMGEYPEAVDRYMRLALKAQSQCRATLKCLADIKNPAPLAFVKQANIAHNQQVNNGAAQPAPVAKTETRQNELLTEKHGETLDPFGTRAAGETDPALETVGAINRPTDTRR